jgi:hypothetical protein
MDSWPPGTVKSTTSLAFASTLFGDEWVVTWIRLRRTNYPICVRFEGDSKKTRHFDGTSIEELEDVLYDCDVSPKKYYIFNQRHIIFIDGYARSDDQHIGVQKACYQWLKEDKINRRLVVVCSMSYRGKTKLDEDKMNMVEEFFVFSWELEEYQNAVSFDDFFNSVKDNLDASNAPIAEDGVIAPSRFELVESKFYFAGGCSRFMFRFATSEFIDYLDDSVSAVEDVLPYIKGRVGDHSNGVINRLFGCYQNVPTVNH